MPRTLATPRLRQAWSDEMGLARDARERRDAGAEWHLQAIVDGDRR